MTDERNKESRVSYGGEPTEIIFSPRPSRLSPRPSRLSPRPRRFSRGGEMDALAMRSPACEESDELRCERALTDGRSDYSACYACAACYSQNCREHGGDVGRIDDGGEGGDGTESGRGGGTLALPNDKAAPPPPTTTSPGTGKGKGGNEQVAVAVVVRVDEDDNACSGGRHGTRPRKPLFVQAFWRNGPGQGRRDDAGDADDARRRLRQRLAPPSRGSACGRSQRDDEGRGNTDDDDSRLMFVFFHGNYFTHKLYQEALEAVRTQTPHGMLAVELRGYTDVTSQKASEESVYEDGRAAMRFLLDEKKYALKNIVLCGYSMGTAVAVQLAVEFPDVHSVLLFAPIKSMPDAGHFHTRLPLAFLEEYINNRFENDLKIGKVVAPLLMVHGKNDEVLPFWYAEYLYAHAVNTPCRALFVTEDVHAPRSWRELWAAILYIYQGE